jgi:hypothetical protein
VLSLYERPEKAPQRLDWIESAPGNWAGADAIADRVSRAPLGVHKDALLSMGHVPRLQRTGRRE